MLNIKTGFRLLNDHKITSDKARMDCGSYVEEVVKVVVPFKWVRRGRQWLLTLYSAKPEVFIIIPDCRIRFFR